MAASAILRPALRDVIGVSGKQVLVSRDLPDSS